MTIHKGPPDWPPQPIRIETATEPHLPDPISLTGGSHDDKNEELD